METLTPAVVEIAAANGLSIACEVTGPQLRLEGPDEQFQGMLAVQLELAAQDNSITACGTIEGTAWRQCVRCLTDYADPLSVSVYAEYVKQSEESAKPAPVAPVRKSARRAAPVEEPDDEADESDELYRYQGDHLDLVPMLREQVILAAPMQPICQEACRGLCPQCGQNLNEQSCACPPHPDASPFRVVQGRRARRGRA